MTGGKCDVDGVKELCIVDGKMNSSSRIVVDLRTPANVYHVDEISEYKKKNIPDSYSLTLYDIKAGNKPTAKPSPS